MPKDPLPKPSEKAPDQPTPSTEKKEGEKKPFPLLDLPPDLLAEVLKKLPPSSVVRLSRGSSGLRAFVVGRDDIWTALGGKKQTIQIQVDDVTQQKVLVTAYQDFNKRMLALPNTWQQLVSEGRYTLADAEKIRSILKSMIAHTAFIRDHGDKDDLSPAEVKKFQDDYAALMKIPAYQALDKKFPSLLAFTREELRRAEEEEAREEEREENVFIGYYIDEDAIQYAQKFLEGSITFREAAAVPVALPPKQPTAYLGVVLLVHPQLYQILHETHQDGTPLMTFEQMAKIPPSHFYALINENATVIHEATTLTPTKLYKGLELLHAKHDNGTPLITIEQIAELGFVTLIVLIKNFDNTLVVLREKLLTPEQIKKISAEHLKSLLKEKGLVALREKIITLEQLIPDNPQTPIIAPYFLGELLKNDASFTLLRAKREDGTPFVTLSELTQLPADQRYFSVLLQNIPTIIQALSEKRDDGTPLLTVEQLTQMPSYAHLETLLTKKALEALKVNLVTPEEIMRIETKADNDYSILKGLEQLIEAATTPRPRGP
jgi:hypothetical protein